MNHSSIYFLLLCAFAVFAVGCGSNKLYAVRGTVTVDGTPMPNVALSFQSDDAKVTGVAYGVTDASGAYSLWFPGVRIGAPAGTHTVTFLACETENNDGTNTRKIMESVKELTQKATVKRKSNVIDFELTTR